MHCSSRKTQLKWDKGHKGYGSTLKPHPRNQPPGYFVAYNDGLVKYSKKPILMQTARNDYGTLLRGGKVYRPRSDFAVLNTTGLIQ